jgi:hypothetical protein
MTEQDLDDCYKVLSDALAAVGEERAALLLATLSLSLIVRETDAKIVRDLIAQAGELART